jgi:hypothetical protein
MLTEQTLSEVLFLEGVSTTVTSVPCVIPGIYMDGPPASRLNTEVAFNAMVVGISPSGSVQFRDGSGAPIASDTLASTNRAVSRATMRTSTLAVGAHSIGGTYSGDTQNAAAAVDIPLPHVVEAVTPGQSRVILEGSTGSVRGSVVTFVATVVGNQPTGTVQFKDFAANLQAAVPLVGGLATIRVSDLNLGIARTITAVYSGDGANASSTSNEIIHKVSLSLPSIAFTSSASPVAAGAPIRLTATLTANNGSVTPTGSVTFRDGAAAIGSAVPLSGGAASLDIATLYPGQHYLRADYSGDSQNGPTSSNVLVQDVSLPSGLVQLTLSKLGGGSGIVTSVPAGIDCGASCSASFAAGASVTLSATAAAGSIFTGWAGGGCSGKGACTLTLNAAATVTATFSSNPPRLANISTRMQVLTGDNVLIGGFIIGGPAPKTVVVRARGPSLTALGVPGALANPVLNLYSGQTVIASNDDFGTAPNAAQLQASGFAPSNALESAILVTLNPGPYTAIVSGAGGATGVGIIEVFEVDEFTTPLINIATRGQVLTADNDRAAIARSARSTSRQHGHPCRLPASRHRSPRPPRGRRAHRHRKPTRSSPRCARPPRA